jgi:hypothetical protein
VVKLVLPLCSQIIVLGSVSISVLPLLTTMATIRFAISPALSKFFPIFLYLLRMRLELAWPNVPQVASQIVSTGDV